ncbi:helix-turn-helix domain-containing protein [Streptomyces sp. NPDC003395]
MAEQARAEDARERLIEELRRLKAASRLSFERLADRTHYSRSSWERFLNGKQLPTRAAVEQLAAVAGEEAAPLLALLDGATATESPAVHAPPTDGTPVAVRAAEAGPEPKTTPSEAARGVTDGRRRGFAVAGYIAAGALMGSLATGLLFTMSLPEAGPGAATTTEQAAPGDGVGTASAAEKVTAGCRSDTCIGRDPQAMDCQWDAVTARQTWLRGMHIELRYSAACQSLWGRIENGAVGDTVTIKDRTELEQTATIRIDRDTYTKMLAVSAETPAETVTVCGAIPSQKQMECSPDGAVQP